MLSCYLQIKQGQGVLQEKKKQPRTWVFNILESKTWRSYSNSRQRILKRGGMGPVILASPKKDKSCDECFEWPIPNLNTKQVLIRFLNLYWMLKRKILWAFSNRGHIACLWVQHVERRVYWWDYDPMDVKKLP